MMDANNPAKVWLGDKWFLLLAIDYNGGVDLERGRDGTECTVRMRAFPAELTPDAVPEIRVEIPGFPVFTLVGPWRMLDARCGTMLVLEARYRREADGWFTITQEA